MNITLIRSNKRKNSTTYNSAEYLISKLENVDKVYEFTLPEDMPGRPDVSPLELMLLIVLILNTVMPIPVPKT